MLESRSRLVKCPKLGINFSEWEDPQEDGSLVVSACPFVSLHRGEFSPRCDGLDLFGKPCIHATVQVYRPEGTPPSDG